MQHTSPEWQNPIAFRDFLRIHPDVARKYLELKRSPARQEYENPFDYSAQKSESVAEVLSCALRIRSKNSECK